MSLTIRKAGRLWNLGQHDKKQCRNNSCE